MIWWTDVTDHCFIRLLNFNLKRSKFPNPILNNLYTFVLLNYSYVIGYGGEVNGH